MEWFLYHSSEKTGPFSEEDFLRMGREGKFGPADLVWNSTMNDWAPAGQVPGLLVSPPAGADQQSRPGGPEKEAVLQMLLTYSDAGPFRIERGTDTDILISNEIADSSWFSGKKKVTYTARILLREEEKTAYYWEMLKESSAGLSFSVGFQKKKVKGIEVFQQIREKGYSPTGEPVYDYQFDYGSLRDAFKKLLESRGWKIKVVLSRGKASY